MQWDDILTIQAMRLKDGGKLDKKQYKDLIDKYIEMAHVHIRGNMPDPDRPGANLGEDIPEGLGVWDVVAKGKYSIRGAGWYVKGIQWFSIRSVGTWRMALIKAK